QRRGGPSKGRERDLPAARRVPERGGRPVARGPHLVVAQVDVTELELEEGGVPCDPRVPERKEPAEHRVVAEGSRQGARERGDVGGGGGAGRRGRGGGDDGGGD